MILKGIFINLNQNEARLTGGGGEGGRGACLKYEMPN